NPSQSIVAAAAQNAVTTSPIDSIQADLARAAINLNSVLDDSWRRYLALPAEVFDPARHPSPQAVEAVLQRFNAAVQNRQYQALTERPEFRTVHQLLQSLDANLKVAKSGQIALPPPPQTR